MRGKVAIMTDIHGNAPALNAVLADIDERGDIEHIYCLGDMISIGPDTNEVLATLFDRADISMVMGNHDEYVLMILAGNDWMVPRLVGEHERWIAERMDPRYVEMLAALPHVLTPVHAGRRLMLRHYHPAPDLPYASVDWNPSLERLEEIYRDVEADVVCFGHHHPTHLFRSERRVYLNPGALGCHDRASARYAIVDLTAAPVGVTLREVPYDNEWFLASYEALDVPARDFILPVFHGRRHAQVTVPSA